MRTRPVALRGLGFDFSSVTSGGTLVLVGTVAGGWLGYKFFGLLGGIGGALAGNMLTGSIAANNVLASAQQQVDQMQAAQNAQASQAAQEWANQQTPSF